MKKVALFFYLPVLLLSGELKDSLIKAKKEQKPIMVYVKAESCQYCDRMKNETLGSASVRNNMKGFIFTAVDKEDAEAKKYLPATRYTPTIYFISPKFKVVNTVKGYLGKDDFNLWIDDTKSRLGMNGSETSVIASDVTNQSDVWMYDMASAKDYAQQTGKQIMVYVEDASSKWSKKMRKTTFKNTSVENALDNFVWVKLQKGSSEAQNNGYTPKLVPSVYFLRANGSALATAKGYFAAKDFLQWVKYAKSKI